MKFYKVLRFFDHICKQILQIQKSRNYHLYATLFRENLNWLIKVVLGKTPPGNTPPPPKPPLPDTKPKQLKSGFSILKLCYINTEAVIPFKVVL